MIWVENFSHIFLPYKNVINANIDEFTDEQVRELTDAIHAAGAKCGTQTDSMGSGFFSEITARGEGAYDCTNFTLEDLDYVVDSYRAAARKFKDWGFDAWELNCAGNNFTQWFFSASRNHRDDEYGAQTFENRVRLIKRIIEAAREECGEDFPIQVLMDAINENDGSIGQNSEFNTLEDNLEIAKELEKAGVTSLHVRLGPQDQHATQFLGDLYFDTPGCIGSTSFGTQFDFSRHFQGKLVANHDGCGLMLNLSKAFKDVVSIPVGTVTYLDPAHAPDFTDKAIADGMVDFLMMNRPLTVDNNYVNKLTEGRLEEIRPCSRCCHCWNDSQRENPSPLSSHFGGMDYSCRFDPIRDMVGQPEKGGPDTFDPAPADGEKRVMVVGAGPAGMEAARIAAERGYDVTLYEKSGMLGGLLGFAEAIKGPHQNLGDYVRWSENDLALKGVDVVCGQEVTDDFIREQAPDVLIVAVGGAREGIDLAGDEATQVISIDEVASAPIGQNVTIVGSNCQATDVCMWLLAQGKHVDIVTPDGTEDIAKGQSIWCRKFSLPMMYARGTRVWTESELVNAAAGEVTVRKATGVDVTYPCDTVIVAKDMVPNRTLGAGLEGVDVRYVGDCNDPWNIKYAVRSGNYAAREI